MYECFHCGHRSVVWDSDFIFEDFGYEGEGDYSYMSLWQLWCSN